MRIGPFMFATVRGVASRHAPSERPLSTNRAAAGWAARLAVAAVTVIILCLFLALLLAPRSKS